MAKKKPPKPVPDDFAELADLDILPGDEVVLEDGTALAAVGYLQGGLCFRPLPYNAADGFVWPPATARMKVTRSPNRERQVNPTPEVDPLRG